MDAGDGSVMFWISNDNPELTHKARQLAGERFPGRTCIASNPDYFDVTDEEFTRDDIEGVFVQKGFGAIIDAYRALDNGPPVFIVRGETMAPSAVPSAQKAKFQAQTEDARPKSTDYIDEKLVADVLALVKKTSQLTKFRALLLTLDNVQFVEALKSAESAKKSPRKTVLRLINGRLEKLKLPFGTQDKAS